MTAQDGEGMCPKIKAYYICCDGDGILLLSSINKPSQDSNVEYEGFDHNYFGYLSSIIVKS